MKHHADQAASSCRWMFEWASFVRCLVGVNEDSLQCEEQAFFDSWWDIWELVLPPTSLTVASILEKKLAANCKIRFVAKLLARDSSFFSPALEILSHEPGSKEKGASSSVACQMKVSSLSSRDDREWVCIINLLANSNSDTTNIVCCVLPCPSCRWCCCCCCCSYTKVSLLKSWICCRLNDSGCSCVVCECLK